MIQINNPGNTRPGCSFQGEVGTEKGFSVFDTLTNGIRAYYKNLHTAIFVHGRKTIRHYITAYAPPSENDTEAYIAEMSKGTGVGPDQPINTDPESLIQFALIQFKIENGANEITSDDCKEGLEACNCQWS